MSIKFKIAEDVIMKWLRIFLIGAIALFASIRAFTQVRPDQRPEELAPTNSNWEFYSQKNGTPLKRTTVDSLGKNFRLSFYPNAVVNVLPSGNALALRNKLVRNTGDTVYLVDFYGSARIVAYPAGLQSVTSTGPLTGAGTSLNPIGLLGNWVDSFYVKNRSIPPYKLSQYGAATGQVIIFNGTNWVPGTAAQVYYYTAGAGIPPSSVGFLPTPPAPGPFIAFNTNTGEDWKYDFGTDAWISGIFVNTVGAVTGDGSAVNPIKLAQNGATNGQALLWSSGAGDWVPGTVSGGGSSGGPDSTWIKNAGTYANKKITDIVRRLNKIAISPSAADTVGMINIYNRPNGGLNWPAIYVRPDTTPSGATNVYFKVDKYKNSPYTYAPFGIVAEDGANNASPGSPPPYGDYVWSLGPNCKGNSGVSWDNTKPMASINWETSWVENGNPTFEWHEHFKSNYLTKPTLRLKSYTIRYKNSLYPGGQEYVDLYQQADNFSIKQANVGYNSAVAYWGVNTNRATGISAMNLNTGASDQIQLSGNGTGLFNISLTSTSSPKILDISSSDITQFNGGASVFTKSTNTFSAANFSATADVSGTTVTIPTSGFFKYGSNRVFGVGAAATNVYLGVNSGSSTFVGTDNTGIGFRTFQNATASNLRGVAIGTDAQQGTTNNVGTISIGAYSCKSNSGAVTKAVVMGDSAAISISGATLSNKLWIENSPGTTPLFGGDFTTNRIGINITNAAPAVTLDVNGTDAIKMPTGTTAQRPTGAAGLVRLNTDLNAVEMSGTGNTFFAVDQTLVATTANAVCSNTTAVTSLGGVTIPANYLASGAYLKISAQGFINTDAVTPGSLRIGIVYGTDTIYSASKAATIITGATKKTFVAEFSVRCSASGASGALRAQGFAEYESDPASIYLGLPYRISNPTLSDSTVNTTTAKTLSLFAQWSIADADNGLSITNFTITRQ